MYIFELIEYTIYATESSKTIVNLLCSNKKKVKVGVGRKYKMTTLFYKVYG